MRRRRMEGLMEDKSKLFREKSVEAVSSPESLNDYLRVTSPGVWILLAGGSFCCWWGPAYGASSDIWIPRWMLL